MSDAWIDGWLESAYDERNGDIEATDAEDVED
jgi:hypothetical protein